MPNLISLRQIRENELYDYVIGLLGSGLSTVSGISGVNGISGIYTNYENGNITVGFSGCQVTGSNPIGNFNFTGIGGAQVILSGNNILISGEKNSSTSSGGNISDFNKIASFNKYGQLDYRTTIIPDLNHDIDKRIWGLTASTGNKLIFSTLNHTTATYVRNTGCWAYGIDLTPISVWNSQGGDQRGGILISPRHVLMANHFPITGGAVMRWVDNNNNVVSGGLSGSIQIGSTDLRIGVLSGDITGNISYAKVFSNIFTGYFNTSGIPLLFTDQEEKVLVGQASSNFNSNVNIVQSSNIYRSGFYETPIGGDSGNPICSVIGNELVVLSTFYSSNEGPYISDYYTGVNSAINSLGNSNNYQLTPVSQNYFPINWNQIKDAPNLNNISVSGISGFLNNIVYTSGMQTISGEKTFTANIIVLGLNIGFEGANVIYNTANGNSIDVDNAILNYSDTQSLNWESRQLISNWSTNTIPTQSGHIINKGYLDNNFVINSYEQINISGTGLNNITPVGRNHSVILNITSGLVGNYTGTLIIPTGNRVLGDKVTIQANYDASTNQNLEIYSVNTGSTNLLFTWPGDGTVTKIYIDCLYTGLGYTLMDAHFIG